jgi:hypothetical protein
MFLFTHNEQLENLTIAHSVWAYFLLLLLFDAGPSWSERATSCAWRGDPGESSVETPILN